MINLTEKQIIKVSPLDLLDLMRKLDLKDLDPDSTRFKQEFERMMNNFFKDHQVINQEEEIKLYIREKYKDQLENRKG